MYTTNPLRICEPSRLMCWTGSVIPHHRSGNSTPVHQMRGYHKCELCSAPTSGVHVRRGDEEQSLGSAQIRVFGSGDATYAAPNLIYHYVVDHHYRPPEAFIQAVLEGP